MKRSLPWVLVLVLAAVVTWLVWPYFADVQLPESSMSAYGAGTARARVTQIIDQGTIDLGGHVQNYQVARVVLLEGQYQGIPMEIDYGKRQLRTDDYRLNVGDKVLVSISKTPDNTVNAYFVDFVRTTPLLWLAGLFSAAILLISRWKGLRALLSMLFSLVVIIGYIIPHILAGEDPLTVSLIGSAILLSVTLYLTYGWNLKSHSAVLGMIVVLLLTGALSALFVVFARLNGTGDENSMFLIQSLGSSINLRGLLLGGYMIGALGVLDDLVTTQASAVFELHHANPQSSSPRLFGAAMRIGQDHVAATVNTLVLAYAGASLPMLLLFSLAHGNYAYLVNFAVVAEEIVRTLVGSLGLIAAVPVTTLIAVGLARYSDRLGAIRQFLGPEGQEFGHMH